MGQSAINVDRARCNPKKSFEEGFHILCALVLLPMLTAMFADGRIGAIPLGILVIPFGLLTIVVYVVGVPSLIFLTIEGLAAVCKGNRDGG